MRNWKTSLKIKDAWVKAQNEEITTEELIKIIMQKTKTLNIKKDYWLDAIMEKFEEMLDIGDPSKDDFDIIWNDFYDWADNNDCWVETF